MSPTIIPLWSWKRFPAYVRPNRATASLLHPAQNTLHLLLGLPRQSHTSLNSMQITFPPVSSQLILFLRKVNPLQPLLSYCKLGRFSCFFVVAVFFMEGHSLGMFDNKQAGARRNIILGCLDWNNNNLQVR